MPEGRHKQVPVLVWVDVDEGVAQFVRALQRIPGVRTLASCQGTLGEGGPNPYRAQVMVEWLPCADEALARFDKTMLGVRWAYVHPPLLAERSEATTDPSAPPGFLPNPTQDPTNG